MKNNIHIKRGQTVYTINNKTNEVDEWIFCGSFESKDEIVCNLMNGTKQLFLPKRCLFETKEEAKKRITNVYGNM